MQVPGAGPDRIDRLALPDNTMPANAYSHEPGIAEYVIGAILGLPREFCRLDRALRRRDWQSQRSVGLAPPPVWPELSGKTVGILGYGRIGQSVARRVRALDMQGPAIPRNVGESGKDDLVLPGGPEKLEAVLRRRDSVVISTPTTRETIGWIDYERLRLMKPSAFLIIVLRAEIVDEDALYHALSRRQIAGAALDVWSCYPRQAGPAALAVHPFRELPNVHVSGWTDGTFDARAKLIADNPRRVACCEVPLNLVSR